MYDPRTAKIYYKYKIPTSQIQELFTSGSPASRLIGSDEFSDLKTKDGQRFGSIILNGFDYFYITVIEEKNHKKLKSVWKNYEANPDSRQMNNLTIDKIANLIGDTYLIMDYKNAPEIASIKLPSGVTSVGYLHAHMYYNNYKKRYGLNPPYGMDKLFEYPPDSKRGRFSDLIE
jgi:hypothetical protein